MLLSDDKHHGVTIHYVNEVVDAGAIIAQGILQLPDSPDERKMIDNIHLELSMIYILKSYLRLLIIR